jgi:hypothetical protein
MGWRNCEASLVLVREINARWPNRDKASDGTIGDAAHASRSSDHNPWVVVNGQGVVRARDIDRDGIDAGWLAEYLRGLGAKGDPRLTGGGYVIWNRRITTPDFRAWKAYTGSNPHTAHVHVSFSRLRAGFDSTAGWGIAGGGAAPAPPANATPGGLLERGMEGPAVAAWQLWCNVYYSRFRPPLDVDGIFGDATHRRTAEVQQFRGIEADGVVGPDTRRATNFRG